MLDMLEFAGRFLAFALIHSVLAVRGVQERIKGVMGSWGGHYRILYNLLSLVVFAWVLMYGGGGRVLYFAPGLWSIAMYLLQAVVFLLLFLCLRQTGIQSFLGIGGAGRQEGRLLAIGGFYRFVRHPLYALSMLFLLLNPVMTVRWATLILLSGCYFVIGAIIEEKRLEEDFGEEYREYAGRTPYMIPRIPSYKKHLKQDTE